MSKNKAPSDDALRLLAEASRQHRQGALKEAAQGYRKFLKKHPKHADALHRFGMLRMHQGRPDEAAKLLKQAVAADGGVAAYHANLGDALRAEGKHGDAARSYRGALRLAPETALIHNNLALALRDQDQIDEALAAARRALELEPGLAQAHNTLGNLLRLRGDYAAAADQLNEALRLAPGVPILVNNLGLALQEGGRLEEAIERYGEALRLEPRLIEGHCNLGNALRDKGELHQAVEHYREALKLAPEMAEVWTNLAFSLESLNRLEEAEEAVERARKLDRRAVRAGLILGCIRRRQGRIDEAITLLEHSTEASLPPQYHAHALYNLGQAREKAGRFTEAFDAFRQANDTVTENTSGAMEAAAKMRDGVRRLRQWLDASPRPPWSAESFDDGLADPVFFIGFPRSGTTLLEQILSAHPDVITTDEREFLSRSAPELDFDNPDYPANLATLSGERLLEIRRNYHRIAAEELGRELTGLTLVDKLPLNLTRIATINRLFPNAKVILGLRDPRDSCLSCYFQNFQINRSMANFLRPESTGAFYAEVMGSWLAAREKLEIAYTEVRYEDVVEDFERIARETIEFLGLPWNDELLEYRRHAQQRFISTPSYQQVVQPIYRSSTQRWRRFEEHTRTMVEPLSPFIEAFGYER